MPVGVKCATAQTAAPASLPAPCSPRGLPRRLATAPQGHELNVLRGMGSLLGAPPYPVLLMEYEEPLQVGAGFEPMEVLQYLKAKGYRAFCPIVNGTIDASAMPKEEKGVNAQGSSDAVLFDDVEEVKKLVLPGGSYGSRPPPPSAEAGATWVLGSALEPQRGKPSCIDAVFIHERRLRPRARSS